jgi:hypothetical protein
MIQAPQWAQINQSGNIEVSGIAKLVYVRFTQTNLYYICLPLRLGAPIATLAPFGALTST